MANYEATRYDWDGQFLTGIEGVNTGLIVPWSSASIPSGFLECNGQSVSTSTYANLFAVIGYTYGGSGASFNVPDLTDRIVVNKSNTKNLAQTGGANTVTPTGNIGGNSSSTAISEAEMPSHLHGNTLAAGASNAGSFMAEGSTSFANSGMSPGSGSTGGGGGHTHGLTATFTGSGTSVLQPFLVVVYIIKT